MKPLSPASGTRVYLFGAFRLESHSQTIHLPTRKVESLLAYLALYPEPHSREELAALLWGDSPDIRARNSLRNALAAIRKALGKEALLKDRESVQLIPVWVDVRAFEECLRSPAPVEHLLSALKHYQGDLLADSMEQWVIRERDRLRELYVVVLLRLADHHLEQSGYAEASKLIRRVLSLDHTNEMAHQRLMTILAAQGERVEALKQYEECKRVLHEELEVEPSPETFALRTRIMTELTGAPSPEAPAASVSNPVRKSGEPDVVALPAGTITFLFVDIPENTTLREQYPETLARHYARLNESMAGHGGHLFQFLGVAFCAAFHTATDALDAALAAQHGLHKVESAEPGPLHVRMALHSGAARLGASELASGQYVPGDTLNRAARLLAVGHAGQVLLSEATRALIEADLPSGVSLRDLGRHRLKDMRQAEPIHQLVISDLPSDFPPLKSLEVRPSNLPIQLTSFVGREKELVELKRLLRSTRLVTVTGTGGIGKTRLALQVGAEVLDAFADGVWLVELAPVLNAGLVLHAVATSVGVREEAGRPLMVALQHALSTKNLLLILDNCEHLVEACAQLSDALLRACPGLKVLACSREALGIAGESRFRVPSLSLPEVRHVETPDDLAQFDAVHLLIDRAVSAQSDFRVTNANAAAVAQVCRHLDGIPLAIELAAARIKGMSINEIAARLDDRFRLLTSGNRGALPRQQTLRASIDWSYDLLPETERILFRRLAVFEGSFTLQAVEAVCADESLDRREAVEGLLQLVDKSLVLADEQGTEKRYRYLETIRQYARERLIDSKEEETTRNRHLAYFLERAKGAGYKLRGAKGRLWLDCLKVELDNLRAALEWALDKDPRQAVQLMWSLHNFFLILGYRVEQREWVSRILARTEGFEPSQTRVRALLSAGLAAYWQFDFGTALPFFEQALTMGRTLGCMREIALALLHCGICSNQAGNYTAARAYFEESVKVAQELGDEGKAGRALIGLASQAMMTGELDSAQALFQSSLTKLVRTGDRLATIALLNLWGALARVKGDYAAAAERYQEALEIEREGIGQSWFELTRANRGWVALRSGDLVLASSCRKSPIVS